MALTPLELNEIANLIDVNVIRKLGLNLGFEHAEIQRYEKTNNQNPSQCIGTEDMLVAWHRNGGTRELLCMALRRVEQGRLAIRIESGEFQAVPVAAPARNLTLPQTHFEPEAGLHTGSSDSSTEPETQQHTQGRVAESVKIEDILPDLAQDISHNSLDRLGHALKFRAAQINRYESTNYLTGRVSTRGTRDMLNDWKSRTSISIQKEELREALIKAGMMDLADQYLPLK